jgi:outer membrane protein OmpA-like peptidoglycan-associated protein
MIVALFFSLSSAADKLTKEEKKKQELDELQERFKWWPTDAKPAPMKDPDRAGYWWWPKEPGEARPWGNRGYVYVYKIIFDYKEEELPAPKPQELRPSLLIKKIIKNVKIYFDYDKAVLRDDAAKILKSAVGTLNRNPDSSILITGNCDIRGSEAYNEKLGKRRGAAVKAFMMDSGISDERIKIVSRGKLDAVAHVTDLVGMQKDRNAQFMIAEVEEVMIPYNGMAQIPEAKEMEEGKYVMEEEKKIESEVKVETREYVIKKGDTFWKIAERELGSAHRWKYLYELNKDKIKNPNKLKAGQKIIIPVE